MVTEESCAPLIIAWRLIMSQAQPIRLLKRVFIARNALVISSLATNKTLEKLMVFLLEARGLLLLVLFKTDDKSEVSRNA